MTDENYFVIKNFCDLTSPVRFRVGSPNKFHSHYDSEPEAMLEILLRVFKKSSKRNLKGFGIRDAVGVWLSSPRGAVDPKARIHWGGDGMGLMIPPQEKFPLGVIQEAAALRTSISFAYMKAGELPVIVSGIPRAVDSARRLVVLDSPSPTHPRNFLVDEIVGFYEKPVNGLVSWCFELEPLSRGRLKVTLSLEDGFPRKTQRRIARRSEAGKLLATQPEVQGTLAVEGAIVRGDLIELATADGRVFGLRVEYERGVSHD